MHTDFIVNKISLQTNHFHHYYHDDREQWLNIWLKNKQIINCLINI